MTSSYCAPCIADLALVREAVTSVAGTASCMAHAVLLTHGTDDPARRRQRLDALGDLARGKAETAEPAEQVKLELLVQEYGLAGAMDMGTPSRRSGGQRGGGQGQPGGQHGGGQAGAGQAGAPFATAGGPGEERRPKSRRGRGRGEGSHGQPGQPGQHSQGQQGQQGQGPGDGQSRRDRRTSAERTHGETAPVTPAPGPAGEGVPEVVPVSASLAEVATTETPAPVLPSSDSAPADTALSASPGAPAGTTPTAAPLESAPTDAAAPSADAGSTTAAEPARSEPSGSSGQPSAAPDLPVPLTPAPDA